MAASESLERKLHISGLVFIFVGIFTFSGADSFSQQLDKKLSFLPAQSVVGRPEKDSTKMSSEKAGEYLLGRERFRREACVCNQQGTFYGLCHPLPAYGKKCICKRGYTGDYCDKCSFASYGYPTCKSCNCNVFGSLVSKCHNVTGQCLCKERIKGRTCDRCVAGFFRFPICQECICPRDRTTATTCDSRSGACFCLSRYEGENCERCKLGYFGFPQCNACNCSSLGSNSSICDRQTGQCACKDGFTGLRCDRCTDVTQTNPDCSSDRAKGTLEKERRPATTPLPTLRSKTTIEALSQTKSPSQGRKSVFCEGNFTCQRVDRSKFSFCPDLFYNDTESRFSSCAPCGCFGEGTLSSILSCDKSNGKCYCKNHVQGQTCDQCMKGFYDARNRNIFGCNSCQCNDGGSTGKGCDDHGNCRCQENIGGRRCDRVKRGNYFLPDLFHIKFELEDGKRNDGSQSAFGYSHVIFPDFTWKGYVTFGDDQEQISLKIRIAKSSHYKVLVKYVLLAKQNGSAFLTIGRIPSEGAQEYQGRIVFPRSVLRSSYAMADDLNDMYLEAGDWLIRIASKSRGLYLDHVSLLPQTYYRTEQLLVATPGPCHVGIRWFETCAMYEYVSVSHFNAHAFPGYTGRVLKGSVLKPALNYDDPDLLRILKLDKLGMMSFHQDTIVFSININRIGKYHVILEYFNAGEKVYRINVKEGGGISYEHHVMISKCPYTFLCRSAVLSETNVLSVFELNGKSTITLNGQTRRMIGIHRLIVIPVAMFSNEHLRPHFKSVVRDGAFIKHTRLPAVEDGIYLANTKEDPATYTAIVPASTWWALILTYNQPSYLTFQAELVFISGGETSKRYIDVKYCPSMIGCRSSVSLYLGQGAVKVTVRRPIRRDFVIESLSFLRSSQYDTSTANPTHLDMSEEYKATCIDGKNLPIRNPLSQFCRTASFTQISKFNGGAKACSCHPRGSVSKQCENIGGQCKCHRNIIGRRCHSCRAGFYNFPYCINCRCFMTGSIGPECDRNGQCNCQPRYGGRKCNRCKSSLFYAFPYCKPCDCNTQGALGQFCSSQAGQCQCLSNFRGRKCDMCQVGFYDFPRCVACTCNAAGIKANENGTNGCFPGEKNQCSCKENVEGVLCDRCKDLYFSLQLSNPKGCIPCKCDRSGTVNGIATCEQSTGQCYCKRNVDPRSRTCDVCKDGFYGLDEHDVFGCKPCECNPGGSTSSICEKKTGRCTCKPNITGRKCDRLSSKALYMPTLHHLQYRAADGVSVNGKSLVANRNTGLVTLAEPVQWKVTLPKRAKYIFVMSYRMNGKEKAEIKLMILHAIYKSVFFETKSTIKKSNQRKLDKGTELFVLRRNGEDFPLDLYGGTYIMQLFSNTSDLLLDYISLIPLDYLTGDTLTFKADAPCNVFGNKKHCVRYSYLTIPRKGIYSMELEGTGRKDAEMLDQLKYPMLSINGAIVLRKNQPFSISFSQQTSGEFIFLLQYFKSEKPPFDLLISVQGSTGRTDGIASLAHCPHIFGCRQVLLNQYGVVMKISLQKGVTYNVSFSTNDSGSAALDLLSLIPKTLWSLGFITPTPLCVALKNTCIKTDFIYPEGHVLLPASKSTAYAKPILMPPNIRDRKLRPVLIDKNKNFIRWETPLGRGFFNVIIHYFQPHHKSTLLKIIVNTQFSSIAGNVRLSYCPHIDGCRASILSENSFFDRFEGIYVSGTKIQATFVKLPEGFQTWINYVLLVRPGLFYDSSSVLTERPISSSNVYKTECIQNYDLKPALSRNCFDWLFQLIMGFNDGPQQCNCEIRGSRKASCNLIGGQCPCNKHVTGRTCSHCSGGRILYPRCITGNSFKGRLFGK